MILPDGRGLILGGRRQFNLEYFPHADAAPPLTVFPFLDETTVPDAENNLYPFLHLLPDGTVFVFANDRAIVFDPYNRAPLRRLPPVAGGVPRNYPSSGSSVLLPLHPDAPAHAEVLVCGGAPRGAYHLALRNGTFVAADRTCARVAPTDPDPVVWAIEEMPMARVMGVGVSDRRVLNQLVNLYCMFPIPDVDAKRHKAYTGSGNEHPTSTLRDRSCIPCTEVLVVGGYKQGERGS